MLRTIYLFSYDTNMKYLVSLLTIAMITGLSVSTPVPDIPSQTLQGQDAETSITVWHVGGCKGGLETHDDYTYSNQVTEKMGFKFYVLSRDVRPDEQLDFSTSDKIAGQLANGQQRHYAAKDGFSLTGSTGNACGQFTTTPDAPGLTAGCHSLGFMAECFEL